MNLALQDPFAVAKEYPDTLITTLLYGASVVIEFNHRGDYLASGLTDGTIVIYDLTANGAIVAKLSRHGHTRPVTLLGWSKCGRYLISSSQDWSCKLWDLSLCNQPGSNKSAVIREVTFDGPIWQCYMNPLNPFQFAVSLLENQPYYVDATEEGIKITQLATEPKLDANDELGGGGGANKAKIEKHSTLVLTFTPDGKYIFTGTNKGWINIVDSHTLTTVHSIKLVNANIKNLVISSNNRKLVVNSSDRIVRQINLPDMYNVTNADLWEFEVEHRYQDLVNRLQWNSVAFNNNAEFLVASTYGQSSNDLYIWETSMGSLVKILEGAVEELIDVKWNFPRCMIGSTGLDSGNIYLWSVQFPQKWSALAPDFVEIEENIDYEEGEDEFDLVNEQDLNKKRMEAEDINLVDVTSREDVDARGFELWEDSFVIRPNYYDGVVES
ncbi:chromatin binding protein [Scheffersomyces spartinae]|uniref:Chromatin binding protein n=1 Tax=Scheffersomyces spartinae TaxID=45513 RepID=A0A9P7V677_9ASCO|nr:chromatin binding protein [Scheffersomyces spartinae]KAG7191976.1 chromatin binding protein [Scheffersomyces spartinae]